MNENVESRAMSGTPRSQRRLRNYLLDPRFQLKYTWMIVVTCTAVASSVGVAAHKFARLAQEAGVANEREALILVMAGLLVALVVALFVSGIYITHRIVGPAYKLRQLFRRVREGEMKLDGRLRSGDELQEVFLEFEKMLVAMEARRRSTEDAIDEILHSAEQVGAPASTLEQLRRLQTDLESKSQTR